MTSAAAIPNGRSQRREHASRSLGIGVGELSDAETEHAVSTALEIGVRLIDTAAAYGNEAAVGRAIAASGIPRAEIFVTTKLATADQGFQASQDALQGQPRAPRPGLRRPLPDPLARRATRASTCDSWGGMLKLQGGRAHQVDRRRQLLRRGPRPTSSSCPSSRPRSTRSSCTRCSTRPRCARSTPSTTSSPRPTARWASAGCWTIRRSTSVAAEYGKTPAQVLIRWSLQLGNVVIPRSSSPERIVENFDVFDFELTDRAHGHAQRSRRRHPVPAGPGDLHRHLGSCPRSRRARSPRRRAAPPPTAASIGSP